MKLEKAQDIASKEYNCFSPKAGIGSNKVEKESEMRGADISEQLFIEEYNCAISEWTKKYPNVQIDSMCIHRLGLQSYDVVKREPELKACPVCEKSRSVSVDCEARGHSISCMECEIEQAVFYETREEAVEAWNALPRRNGEE